MAKCLGVVRIVSVLIVFMMLFTADPLIGVSAKTTEDGFRYYKHSDYIEIMEYTGTADEVVVPDTIENLPVKVIGHDAFYNNKNIRGIKLPESVIEIKFSAFANCENLTSVNIPESVERFGFSAFYECKKLETIDLPEGITSISSHMFYGCESLKDINIPESVTKIFDYAFKDCKSLKQIVLPHDLEAIETGAFDGCEGIEKIYIPDSVTYLGSSAFNDCDSLYDVRLSPNLTELKHWTFFDCKKLKHITIPSSITVIEEEAFALCSTLTHIVYEGSAVDFKKIAIGEDNFYFHSSTKHYATTDEVIVRETVNPTCTEVGYIIHQCSLCDFNFKTNVTGFAEHTFLQEQCQVCGVFKDDLIESEHNYPDNADIIWYINKPKAKSVTVTFSHLTQTEQYYDYIFIYDATESLIGKYTGVELASKSITVVGDTVKIRLVSDEANSAYGFSLSNVTAVYSEPEYDIGDVNLDGSINIKDATTIQKHLASILVLSEDSLSLADFDFSGSINIKDATAIQKFIAGII